VSRCGSRSSRTAFSSDLCTQIRLLYSIKPSSRNRFMKKLTRDRVVPIIPREGFLRDTGNQDIRALRLAVSSKRSAKRFSLEFKSWSTKSAWVPMLRASGDLTNTSEEVCSSCITRKNSAFSILSTVQAVMAVAVAVRNPVRVINESSHTKSPERRSVMVASLPVVDTAVSFARPL
jgi:hypothetical protein